MNILYIAFSCSPYHGSEDKIGWNIPVESAKTNRVFVITREEQRQYIERYLREKPLSNIQFIYVDVPHFLQRMLSKAPYTLMLNIFHQYAYRIAKELCAAEHIEVIHQITPVEFRSIGNYGKIPNVKFVCGPLGGAESIPRGLWSYAVGNHHLEMARYLANWLYRTKYTIQNTFENCSVLLANHETKSFLNSARIDHSCVVSEIGISEEDLHEKQKKEKTGKLRLLVVGRLVYRKGHAFLLDAFEQLPESCMYDCWIVGAGREHEKIKKRCETHNILSKHVTVCDGTPYDEVMRLYTNADVCIVPSIRETTGSVILEAMAHGVPVITINRFGGATILDDDTGWLYDGNTKEEFVENLKNAIVACIENPGEVTRKGINAQKRAEEYTWEEKMRKYQAIYDSLVAIE